MSTAAITTATHRPAPLWTRGDLNAFFGLGINMLVNVLVIAGLMTGVVKLSSHDAFQVILIGLAALLLGSAIAWLGGFMDAGAVSDSVDQIAVGLPSLNVDMLANGLEGISPLLATAIPLGIYNFTEAMSNVESAAAAGDSYNLRSVLLADGTGAVVGSCLGSPFPPAVYVGHPGWKAAGGRVSYSLATGVLIFVRCVVGLFPLLGAVLPVPAIVPILLYIGLVIGAQAFRAVPKAHYAAIVLRRSPTSRRGARASSTTRSRPPGPVPTRLASPRCRARVSSTAG
jgi:AGZA family xanthine/uracil permease-like MFS transporter